MALCFAVAKSLHSRSGIEQTDYLEEESVSNIDDRGEGRGCKREREREREKERESARDGESQSDGEGEQFRCN